MIDGDIEIVAVAESASDTAEEKIVVSNYAGSGKKKKKKFSPSLGSTVHIVSLGHFRDPQ